MRKNKLAIFSVILFCLVVGATFCCGENMVADAQGSYVYLGGYPIGISATANGLIVVEVTDVQTENGVVKPLENKGVVKGDILQDINGVPLSNIYLLKKVLDNSEGEVTLTVRHKNGVLEKVTTTPAVCKTNEKKLGVILKEDVSGIGTVTFVTLDKRFGALGHYILDSESGLCQQLNTGKIFNTSINDVVRGQNGKAGGLVASLNKTSVPIGEIERNTNIGIYGRYNVTPYGQLIEIAQKGCATIGKAQIYTTVDGNKPQFYDIEIVKVVEQSTPKEKGLVIHVCDEKLIEKTGGIVQGMSGSPIIQNGKLVGAVTHVFIDDATRGYGVHARFMYQMATENIGFQQQKVA